MSEDPSLPALDPASGAVTFVADERLDGVPSSVSFHLRNFGADPAFRADGPDRWVAVIPQPPVDRLEYRFAVRMADGTEVSVPDPANPDRAPGVFGDLSVIEWPAYEAPRWLNAHSPRWSAVELEISTSVEGVAVTGQLLTPPDGPNDEELPLLVVHDGPEYSRLARLGDYLWWLFERSPELRCRTLLLQPLNRDLSYAASVPYTAALVEQALPRVRALVPTTGPVLGLGASLGALALAHAAAQHPGVFAGLMCQSGSFFLPRFDSHEKRFRFYDKVVSAVQRLHSEPSPLRGTAVTLTAGTGEENLDNNRALARRLQELDVDTTLATGRDGHNYTAWRDLLDPALENLLRRTITA